MSDNLSKARQFLEAVGSGKPSEEIALLFDGHLSFEIQGDEAAFPWIGHRTGRDAVADFVSGLRALTERVTFEVEDILTSNDRAAVVGALATRVKATGKVIESQYVIILTIKNDLITRFQMMEDSFRVSNASR